MPLYLTASSNFYPKNYVGVAFYPKKLCRYGKKYVGVTRIGGVKIGVLSRCCAFTSAFSMLHVALLCLHVALFDFRSLLSVLFEALCEYIKSLFCSYTLLSGCAGFH